MKDDVDFNEIFNDSYEWVLRNDEIFFDAFYRQFLDSSPTIRAAFKNTNMAGQKTMLREAIVYMINFFVSKKASPYLLQLGHIHTHIVKVTPDMYGFFVSSVVACLEQHYPSYNAKCGVAWRVTLAPGIEMIKHAHTIPASD